MTLTTVPRYDPAQVSSIGDHAVVVGGSVAGLVTARVLADGFEEVTVIERDPLPDEPAARPGVAQGRHIHVLLEAGRATFEDLFPGYGEALLSAGGLMIDGLSDLVHYEKGGRLTDGSTRLPMYSATRPLFEQIVRRRLTAREGVAVRPNCRFTEYLVGDGATTVEGVMINDEESEQAALTADLVVDATGRTSRTPAWLENHGYVAPDVDEVRIDVAYSTAVIERPSDDRRAFFVPADPPRTRGGFMFPVEDDRWIGTLFGVHGDHPPTEAEALNEFAASLPVAELNRILDTQPWLSDEIAHYPFPSNLRRRYADLDRFPDGLLVIGDALCSFNPIYGQGMSVAALEALILHDALTTDGRANLAPRFFDRAETVVDSPWLVAVGGDFAFARTDGPKPRGTAVTNRYLARLIRKAHTDGDLREALARVYMMERPPRSLLRPGVLWRVFTPTG